MQWGMQVLPPACHFSGPSSTSPSPSPASSLRCGGRGGSSNWTHEENKLFEYALALFDKDSSDRWLRIASMVPGKTVGEVMKHYQDLEDDVNDIEAGLIPIPGYRTNPAFSLEWVDEGGFGIAMKPSLGLGGKKMGSRPENERRKGVPWTEKEHR